MKRGNLIGNIFCAVIFVLYLRPRVDRLRRRQWPDPWQFSDHHHLTSRGTDQPALFGFSQRLGRRAPLHMVRLAGASCQSLVGYGKPARSPGHRRRRATRSHTFTLRDSSVPSQTVEQTLSLTIKPPLSITTTSLPDASIAAAYNQPVKPLVVSER